MFTTGRKVDAFLWDHVTAMSYSLFRGYIALFIIPDFLTPNIHYSFSFKPRYSLFIIQLPPPKVEAKGTGVIRAGNQIVTYTTIETDIKVNSKTLESLTILNASSMATMDTSCKLVKIVVFA